MNIKDIQEFLVENFKHIIPTDAWGETSFFINPEMKLKRGTYFATLKQKDGDNDMSSMLDRDGVFRLNMGISKPRFEELFGAPPKRPAKGGIIAGNFDFTQTDVIMPHPIYGWMSWVCVLSPSEETFERCKPLLADAYKKAMAATVKKLKAGN